MRNPQAVKDAKRRYRESHREELRLKNRAYAAKRYVTDPAYAEKSRAKSRALDPDVKKARAKAVYAKYAEARREYAVAYRKLKRPWLTDESRILVANGQARRRARIRGLETEAVDRLVVYERDGGRCHLCNKTVSRHNFHIDHLIPISKGGSHTYANVALAHPRCNMRRGNGRLPAQLRLVG